MVLKLIARKDINESKWNACVESSLVGLPYAYTWFLDVVADNWRGIVLRDYEAVFPVPVGKKLGIDFVYQPFFCQQLGLYSSESHLSLEDICLRMISKKYLYCNLNLNYLSALEINKKFTARRNYILQLNAPYEEISKRYSQSQSRNIGKARQAGLVIDYGASDFREFARLFEKNSTATMETYKAKHTKILEKLAEAVVRNGQGELCAVKHPSGEIAAMNLIPISGNRIINLAPVTTEAGRNCGGMHFLLDSYIKKYAETDKVLDFEGSSLPSVAKFYERFGASQEYFCSYKSHVFQPVTQLLRFT
jgi:hypothetical protein